MHLNGFLVHSERVSKGSITPNWVISGKCIHCYMALIGVLLDVNVTLVSQTAQGLSDWKK